MENVCSIAEKCPIFSGTLKYKLISTKVYRSQYCENGEGAWKDCRRRQFNKEFGKVPDNLLPHSTKSIEEILRENNWELLLF